MNKIEIKAQLKILEWVYENHAFETHNEDISVRSKMKELKKRLEQLKGGSDE